MNLNERPKIIVGEIHKDERGELKYNNEFDLSPVKRMYIIKHPGKHVVRAWQGHQKEHKYFQCIKGRFVVAWKKIDDFKNPDDQNKAEYKILNENKNEVLSIPPGYANGLKALENDSEIMVFSNKNLEEAADDQFKFDPNLWLDWDKF
jgi:dTDP-4-dehydrorhamnose 3,5-epimerase